MRRSTPAERDHVRALIADRWDDLAPAVSRAFARIPAIGAGDRAAAAIDLAAVKHYLETGFDGDDAYRACLASGLSRLPTHRGPVLRGVDLAQAESAVGSVVTVPGPCGGTTLSLSDETPRPATTALYVIWSQTARILAPLFDDRLRTGDVMFSPGTELVVLDSRAGGRHGLDLILLQEIPPAGQPYPDALADLRRALDATALLPAGDRGAWPAYALGPVGGLRASAGI